MIALTALERKAAFVAAATLHQDTKMAAAEKCGVSWQHLLYVLDGEREPSAELRERVAEYVGMPVSQLFPDIAA